MNLVAIIGNVASQPELRYTASGKAVCSFRIAISRPGGTEADFITVVTWERQAEICDRYIYIGRRVGIEGRLHQVASTEDNPSRVEIIAHRVQLLGAPRSTDAEERAEHDTEEE